MILFFKSIFSRMLCQMSLLTSKDNFEVHGALVYLAEIAGALKETRLDSSSSLNDLRSTVSHPLACFILL